MSNRNTLQRRTTYLISLTLVKVEAVPEDEEEPQTQTAPVFGKGRGRDEDKEEVKRATEDDGGSVRACAEVEEQAGAEFDEKEEAFSVGSYPERGDVEVRDGRGCSRDNVLLNKNNAGGFVPAPVKESAKSYGRNQPDVALHREVGRPTTELYREPPMLFLKDEEEGNMNSSRSHSNLPVSMRSQVSQRPDVLLRTHAGGRTVSRRELREANQSVPPSAKSLDRNYNRIGDQSPMMAAPGALGPYRASWADSDGRCTLIRPGATMSGGFTSVVTRDSPRGGKLKTCSISLPAPPTTLGPMPQKKGKSRTLDNSDLNLLTDDLEKVKEVQVGTTQRASSRDSKMLKFISGIFTKSAPAPPNTNSTPPSEEEAAVCVNTLEWTFCRTVQELHLGILGGLQSGKSALIHRHMTGSYLPLENPEGGMYRKEVLVDGHSHLLLIREETRPPDDQFTIWVDAVILVFSLENEASFLEVYRNYSQLSVHRNITEIPFIVVGTQDKISSTNPRVIEDARARQLCSDVRRCTYYETCATYGLNVNRVFNDAAQKIMAMKKQAALLASCNSLPNSPSHSGGSTPLSGGFPGQASNGGQSSDYSSSLPSTPVISHKEIGATGRRGNATPGSVRSATRRRASRFSGRRGSDTDRRSTCSKGELGSGRSIPIKQSILLKRSGNSLNKEWKKKYVTLSSDGTLSYHSSVNDYMQNVHGKEIDLLRVTVKVPGKRPPRAVPACSPPVGINGLVKDIQGPEWTSAVSGSPSSNLLPVSEGAGLGGSQCPGGGRVQPFSSFVVEGVSSPSSIKGMSPTSPVADRRKHRRKKSVNQKGDAATGQADAKRKMWKLKSFGSLRNIKTDEDNVDFLIVSSSGQTWHFEAQSVEERNAWVQAIESQILASLQLCESNKNKAHKNSQSEAVALKAIRNARGNNFCVDCEAPNPTWASLNLGALICIECSGIHRNLGTHLSRVRSLDLDDLPNELTLVLSAIGNQLVNSIWEGRTFGQPKPKPDATREERESWIRAKYEQRLFVAPLQPPTPSEGPRVTLAGRLLSAVLERNLPKLLLLLAHSTKEDINSPSVNQAKNPCSSLAPRQAGSALHAACQLGDLVMTQLLIWYGSDVRCRDSQGQTALALASLSGSQECADILLQYGCPGETSPSNAPTFSFSVAMIPSLPVATTSSLTVASTKSLSRNSTATGLSHCGSRRVMS